MNLKELITQHYVKKFRNGGKKRALLCYSVAPFLRARRLHPNELEAQALVTALMRHGYDVDVVDYRRRAIRKGYDLCFGFGNAYEDQIIRGLSDRYILYSTGAPASVQVENTLNAMKRAQEHDDVPYSVSSEELIRMPEAIWHAQQKLSDLYLQLGTAAQSAKFSRYYGPEVTYAPSLYFRSPVAAPRRGEVDFAHSRTHFTWFAGRGVLHKGLDICMRVFSERPDLVLHVFYSNHKAVAPLLHKYGRNGNIIYHGHIAVDHPKFKETMAKCAFALLPSCSEAMATSVVTQCGNAGLLPVVTEEVGFDFDESSFVPIYTLDDDGLRKTLSLLDECSTKQLLDRSRAAASYTQGKHSIEEYSRKLDQILERVHC